MMNARVNHAFFMMFLPTTRNPMLALAEGISRSLEDGKAQRWLAVHKETLSEIIPRQRAVAGIKFIPLKSILRFDWFDLLLFGMLYARMSGKLFVAP
jgi:hypothetical protein